MRLNHQIRIEDIGKTDLHMHTTYCDGKHTPEEMVISAIGKGFSCIGFSGHSFVSFDKGCGMTDPAAYRDEINRLKEKYRDQIRVFCGIEQDYESDASAARYDYVIGSVHYLRLADLSDRISCTEKTEAQHCHACGFLTGNGILYAAIDDTPEIFQAAVEQYFQGDYYLAAEQYFELAADVLRKTNADIIGHFDLISKFNEKNHFFDEQHPRYVNAWKKAADSLLNANKIFEINTGAVSRGWRSVPYPAPDMILYIHEHGGRFILSSDSHHQDTIGSGFSDLLKKYPFL